MSLQGTFDTLSVTEVFGLLSTAGKTGALRLEAGERAASVFVSAGRCCAVEADEISRAASSDVELARHVIDVGFGFARQPSGSFRFNDSELGGHLTDLTTPLEPAIAEIVILLEQWREIEMTIPSLDVRVRVAPVLRDDEIVVSAREWSLLAALGGSPTVRELIDRRGQPMIEVCGDVKRLVDRGAIEVEADLTAAAVAPTPEPEVAVPELVEPRANRGPRPSNEPTHALEPIEPYAPEADEAIGVAEVQAAAVEADAVAAGLVSRMTRSRTSTPDAFADADASDADAVVPVGAGAAGSDAQTDASQDRGALLRLFSALKES